MNTIKVKEELNSAAQEAKIHNSKVLLQILYHILLPFTSFVLSSKKRKIVFLIISSALATSPQRAAEANKLKREFNLTVL